MKSIRLTHIIEDLDLSPRYESSELGKVEISGQEVNRPGLQLAGYFNRFAYERIQVMGNVEWYYCKNLSEEDRYKRLETMFSYDIPCLILTRDLPFFDEMLSLSKKYNRSLLSTNKTTTKFISDLLNYLNYALSPETTVHGVLIEVYGLGVLIMGQSGVGKSETALELIKRGHRLVADDAVEIKRVDDKLVGQSPSLIRHFMEIRGIGILDIERLYGVGAVKKSEEIELVIQLENWDEKKEYDRVGLDENYMDILGINVPKILTPVKPGRNLAMIVEVAARNTRQKRLGYNAAEALNERIKSEISSRKKNYKNT